MKCVTAFYYCVQETQRLRTDLLYIIDINTDQDILDLVRTSSISWLSAAISSLSIGVIKAFTSISLS